MSLFALLAALAAQYAFPPRPRQDLQAVYGRLCIAVARHLDAGDRNSGILAWFALVAAAVLPVALLAGLAAAAHPLFLALVDVAFLYLTLRFRATVARVSEIENALRKGETGAAANVLAEWQGESVEAQDPSSIAKLAAEQALRDAHYGTFAPLFWFLVLPGPLGLVIHPLARRAASIWGERVDAEERDFGWFALEAFRVLDWIPQRVTAFLFAIVGDFEDALYCWRSQAAQWIRREEGIVLASGAGALGVRLGDPVARRGQWIDRPQLGVGEAAGEDALASLAGLLWRALIVWTIVYSLAAAIGVA
jgi:adenosylcobinamide-phosphate synthase